MPDGQTPCQRDGHDYEFMGRRYYDGQRPGYLVDEFYCRKCLRSEMRRADDSDQWYSERQLPGRSDR